MAETQQQVDLKIKGLSHTDIEPDTDMGQSTTMKVYNGAEPVEYTEEEGERVKRKIDRILLPLMCCFYISSV